MMHTMFLTKFRSAAVALLVVGAVLGGGSVTHFALSETPGDTKPVKPKNGGLTAIAQEERLGRMTEEKAVRPVVKWEYKVITVDRRKGEGVSPIDAAKMQESLNNFGADGWECIGPVTDVLGPPGTGRTI
jgi:hypothetical protein